MKTANYAKILISLLLSCINGSAYCEALARYEYNFHSSSVDDKGIKPSTYRYYFSTLEEAQRFYDSQKAKDPYTPVKLIREGHTYLVTRSPITKKQRAERISQANEEIQTKREARVRQEALAKQEAKAQRDQIAREKAFKAQQEAEILSAERARRLANARAKAQQVLHATKLYIISNIEAFINSPKVASLTVGPGWRADGNAQTLTLEPNLQKTFTEEEEDGNVLVSGELFLGIKKPLSSRINSEFGVAVLAANSARMGGDILEDADPDFNNYFYGYSIKHTEIALKGKLISNTNFWVQPFINGRVGIGFNHANDFTITPKIFQEVPMEPFTDNRTTSLTYAIGLGLQKELFPHFAVGAGYEFSSWGKSSLGRLPDTCSTDQTLNDRLRSNIFVNSLLFTLSYYS